LRVIANLSRAVAASHNRLGQEIVIQMETWGILAVGTLSGLHWGLAGVALCALPSFIHNAARMYGLASRILHIGRGSLWRALQPILGLNAIMAAALTATHLTLAALNPVASPLLYLFAMVSVGVAVYGGVFLCVPPAGLRTESARWRQLLARARTAASPLASPPTRPTEKDQA
jgi:hypothetical protein